MLPQYIIDEFSPSDVMDDETDAQRRAAALGRPAVASPAPDVETPAPAPDAAASPATPTPLAPTLDVPDASTTTVPTAAPPTWSSRVGDAISAQEDQGRQASQAMEDFRRRNAQIQQRKDAAVQQRSTDATPIQARDANGNLLQQYKPSVLQRVLRGVGALAGGGVLAVANPRSVGVAGYGDPNSRYGRDMQMQQARVAADDAQINIADKDSKDAFEMAKGYAAETRATGQLYDNAGKLATNQQDAETKTADIPIAQQRAYNESPKGKAEAAGMLSDAQFSRRTQAANSLGLKGTNRTLFLLNGKIPDPRQATSEDIARSQATAAWHRDNPGKQPTLADINSINKSASGRGAEGIEPTRSGQPLGDAAYESEAKAIASGEKKPLAQNSRSSPVQVAVMKRAYELNPNLTDSLYTTRQNFKTKGDADKVQSLGIAVSHASNALENSAKVGLSPMINHPNLEFPEAAKASTAYSKDMTLATDEMGKLIKMGVVTEAEGQNYKDRMMSPRQDVRDAALREFIKNFGARARGVFQKYKAGSGGSEFPAEEFYDKETLENLKRNGVFDRGEPQSRGSSSAAPAGGSSAFDFNAFPVAQ